MSVRVLIGDCREVLRTLPDESVHCVVTSPPYFGLRDYGVAGQIGLEPTPDAYVAEMVAVFREVRRVLRKDGTCWCNLGDSYAGPNNGYSGDHRPSNASSLSRGSEGQRIAGQVRKMGPGLKTKDLIGIPWMVAFALQADGWWLRQDIIWSKPNPMPESVTDRCTKAHEYLFLLTKAATYWYDAEAIAEEALWSEDPRKDDGRLTYDGKRQGANGTGQEAFVSIKKVRNKRSVWTVPSAPFSEAHFATFPPALIEPCIKAGCPEKACGKCGAPWLRETHTERVNTRPGLTQKGAPDRKDGGIPFRPQTTTTTLGFAPSCACNAATVPGVCLDPFGGAGTTGLVADRLGRNAILIELNASYATMGRDRIVDDGPLFAQVEMAL